ncbi:hypothetical protein [Pelagibaculum spongiae]|uniref:hypothetical protein n=1 Tax=Pelagibaculum spongiae TaxID=2080658 RepID=UPI001472E8EE|nr:hypothetical protein [Pelagibaculum spongiae]
MKLKTQSVHTGFRPDLTTKVVATPIDQTTSFFFDNTQPSAGLFDLKSDITKCAVYQAESQMKRFRLALLHVPSAEAQLSV